MLLEFRDDFCAPCEPIAGVWHEGNDSIGRHPIAVIDVVDVYLREIHLINFAGQVSSCSTHGINCVERTAANGNVMSI